MAPYRDVILLLPSRRVYVLEQPEILMEASLRRLHLRHNTGSVVSSQLACADASGPSSHSVRRRFQREKAAYFDAVPDGLHRGCHRAGQVGCP